MDSSPPPPAAVQSPPTDLEAILTLQSSTSSVSNENGNERSDSPSSTDLRRRVTAPDVNRKPRSPGKILDMSRRMAWRDGHRDIKTDEKPDEKVIDRDFAVHLLKSAICLQWNAVCTFEADGEIQKVPYEYEGQIFVLCNPEDGNRMFVTANYNICSEYNEDGLWEEPCDIHIIKQAKGAVAFIAIPNVGWRKDEHFPPYVLRDGVNWSSGIDVSFGPSANVEDCPEEPWFSDLRKLLNAVGIHNVVTDDSVYAVGMKIGIVAFTLAGPDVKKEEGDLDSDVSVYNILGSKNETVVFTGEITHVGDSHIEYNCNSCGGCSGSAVFVLDKSHREFRNVLAVHGGHKSALNSNIGFKLLGAFDKLQE